VIPPELHPGSSPPIEQGSTAAEPEAAGRGARPTLLPASPDMLSALATLVPELKLMTGLVIAAVIVTALYFGRDILIPLSLAFFLGFVLDPMVLRLKRWGLPRAAAVIVVVTSTLMLLGLAGLFLGNQVSALSAQLPTYQSNIKDKLRGLRERANAPGMFDGALKTFDTLKAEVDKAAAASAASDGSVKGNTAAPPPPQRVQLEEKPSSSFRQALSWVNAVSGPMANTGIVLVFVVLILLDRLGLRDRLLRLWGGSLHRSTDALDEASARIGRYLRMQLIINLSHGVPVALGLWLIGIPGALLWGAVAAVLRFVPYVGPMISSLFPITLAFAVDPGWSMVLWTIALIVALEVTSHNLIEPWLYGTSTGLSAMSLMVSAIFWTALWGPVGLIMATPLSVCLLVIGRYLPRLQFLDILLGSRPALDTPTRIYQRLLADDVEEAIDLATEQVADGNVTAFYSETGLPVLRMATSDHASAATAEHRHRLVMGMEALIDDLHEQFPAETQAGPPDVVCIGGKWEVDSLAAKMLAHALSLAGQQALHLPAATVSTQYIASLDLRGARTVCLSYFSPEPQAQARHFCRRLRRRWPEVRIVLALWNAPPELLGEDAGKALGADAVATSINEAVIRVSAFAGINLSEGFLPAPVPEADAERLAALQASGALDARALPIFTLASKRAADIFDVSMATVSFVDEDREQVRSAHGSLQAKQAAPGEPARTQDPDGARSLSLCAHVVANAQTLVVPDLSRDLRFAGNPTLQARGVSLFAGAPLRDPAGHVLGALCIFDAEPRVLTRREVRLLEAMADDVMSALREAVQQWGTMEKPSNPATDAASPMWGQPSES
jgi:predicted PurR-regulated permease PerM